MVATRAILQNAGSIPINCFIEFKGEISSGIIVGYPLDSAGLISQWDQSL